jgi:hypothetical protein
MRHVCVCADAAVVRTLLERAHLAVAQMLRLQRGITYERRAVLFRAALMAHLGFRACALVVDGQW